MTSWVLPAFWLEVNPLTDIWRSFRHLAHEHSLLETTVAILGTSLVLAILARRHRVHIRTALVLYALAFILMAIAAIPNALGMERATQALLAAAMLLVGCAFVKLGSILIFDVLLCITPLSPPQVLRDLMVAGGYAGVGMWLLSRNGVTLSSIVATSAVMTGVIVFSLQDSLSNILGGLVLQIDQSISVGDWVIIDQTKGKVKEITWRHVAIESRNWDTIIIPNSVLIKSQVLIQGQRAGQPLQTRRWVWFNVDFRVPPIEVIHVVTEALVSEPVEGCAVDPAPNVLLMEFKES